MRVLPRLALLVIAGAVVAGCQSRGPDFKIVAGSENQLLEPIVREFCKEQKATCTFNYLGSLDIGLLLRPGSQPDFDAVWPASSIWVDMFDKSRRVSHLQSVAQMPVVLGVRKSKAEELGWTSRPVAMADVLSAVETRNFRFLMTSATQSNSGASAYLSMLAAALGKQGALQASDLDDTKTRAQVGALLAGVERSSGSSGWLGELYADSAEKGLAYDAMWNYEPVLKETNDRLRKGGHELLWAVYPSEGVSVADSPLGFVERGRGKAVEDFFLALQKYLASPAIQSAIAATGRRIPLASASAAPPRPELDWNFDPGRLVTAIAMPEPSVIQAALTLYQEALRRPSLTALCLDFSGSMGENGGEKQLKEAMRLLFTPQQSAELLVQWSPKDQILVIPFTDRVEEVWTAAGEPAGQANLLTDVSALHAGGGTDMYSCVEEALAHMKPLITTGKYLPAIVIMTDGRSEGSPQHFLSGRAADDRKVPIFGITFGDADRSQLDALAQATGARVFDGGKDLVAAFRSARGYN